MNKITLLFCIVICLVAVNARHYGERDEPEAESDEETLRRSKDRSPSRHRRRRWQMNYGYDYPHPSYPFSDRRDYDRNNPEVLQNIYRLLDEISSYVRRPPPPPQPIYIPYPVPYIYPQLPRVDCNNPAGNKPDVNVTKRVKDMEDTNQNWGLVVSNENDYDDGSDGSRPISFEPIVPKQFMKRPSPKVEHGSVQGAHSTEAPKFNDPPASSANSQSPKMCSAAILSCCGISVDKTTQRNCFTSIGCSMTYDSGNACTTDSIQQALESFRKAYSPL